MRKSAAVVGTTIFFFLAPGVVAGLVPWWITQWRFAAQPWDPPPVRWIGWAVLCAGLAGLIECFARFAREGHGTPAPPLPTETLVVSGLYRYVRNPMYVAVLAIILGQALVFGSTDVLVYAAIAWLGTHLFVLLYEEPTLRRRYGAAYDNYRAHVRRWLPRVHPWTDAGDAR
jgi:protein-S-isoprenylcysteine O-methyltransferase Ste14